MSATPASLRSWTGRKVWALAALADPSVRRGMLCLSLSGSALLPVQAAPAPAGDDEVRLQLAAEYVGMVNEVQWLMLALAGPQGAATERPLSPEVALQGRIGRALPRDTIIASLARDLAAAAETEALRNAIAYENSDARRIELRCEAMFPLLPEDQRACVREQADAAQLRQIESAGGVTSRLRARVLDAGAMERALADSAKALEQRDPALHGELRQACTGAPSAALCRVLDGKPLQ